MADVVAVSVGLLNATSWPVAKPAAVSPGCRRFCVLPVVSAGAVRAGTGRQPLSNRPAILATRSWVTGKNRVTWYKKAV